MSTGWQPIRTIPINEFVLILLVPRDETHDYDWVVLDKFNGQIFGDLADHLINNGGILDNNDQVPVMAVAWKHVSRGLSRKRVNQLVGDNRDIGRTIPLESASDDEEPAKAFVDTFYLMHQKPDNA